MRLLTYQTAKGELRPACLINDRVIDIPQALKHHQAQSHHESRMATPVSTLKSVLSLTGKEKSPLEEALRFSAKEPGKGLSSPAVINSEGLILAPPIPDPGKIICVAMNYPGSLQAARPDYPVFFLKPSSTLCGSGSTVTLPPAAERVQFEAELAFYIGQECRSIHRSEAMRVIAGYTIANDMGDSVLEKRTSQWVTGKMFDNFTPAGPYLVTADEIPDPHTLMIQTWLNGDLVQEASAGEMLYKMDEIIAYLSTLTTLHPGDMILTGSPKLLKGKPVSTAPLMDGDRVEISISGLGTLINHIRTEG
jgi:acylpyruvate hydrolase